MRTLIAGDDPSSLLFLEDCLRELGHEVIGTARGLTVLSLVARSRPDLVVLDLDLPGPDIDPVVQELADEHRAAVVVVAGSEHLTSTVNLARHGVGAVVHKPVTLQDLAVAVEVAAARFTDLQDLRRQTEEAQRERVRLLQVFAASADGVYIARREGTLSMVNEAAIRLLGMNLRDMRGRRLSDWSAHFKARTGDGRLLVSDELPLPRALRGEVVGDFEMWIDALDGVTRCLRLSAAPVMNGESAIVEAVAVMRDVTDERLRDQEAARRAEQRRRELVQLSTELLGAQSEEELARRCVARVRQALGASRARLVTVGADGKTRVLSGQEGRPLPARGTTVPPATVGLLGYVFLRGETVRSDDLRDEPRFAADELDSGGGDAASAATGASGVSAISDRSALAAPLSIGDRTLGVLACASEEPGFFDDEDAHLVTLMANQAAIALENLRLADRLAAEQKMAALGVMAAGLVHEIKNPLSYVQANLESAQELLELISRDGPGGVEPRRVDEDREALAEARSGCARMFKIIDDIRTYAHPGRATREPNDVNRLVEVALTLAASELRRWCNVTRDFAPLPDVMCDGAKVSQVVLNLLVNAAQAIERTGRMGRLELSTRVGEGTVRVVVRDDGPGMEPDVLKKIFLPFFTTKPAGVGTGLGLAISRGLMESQGGTIEVESTPGHGSCFTVVLPLDPPAGTAGPERADGATAARESPDGGTAAGGGDGPR